VCGQQRCVGRRIGRGESGLACGDGMDNTSALFDSCITARVVGRSTDPHAESGLLWAGNISASDRYRQRAACFARHPKGNNGASASSDSGDSDDDCGGGTDTSSRMNSVPNSGDVMDNCGGPTDTLSPA
jgi:hypothetical protein